MKDKGSRSKRNFIIPYTMLLVAEFAVKVCLYMRHATITLYILESGGSAMIAGVALGIGWLAAFFLRPYVGGLVDRTGKTLPMLLGTALYCAASAVYLLDVPLGIVLILVTVQGIGYCFEGTSLYSLAADIIPRKYMTYCYTYLNVVETLAAAISTTMAIYIRDHYGFDTTFFVIFVFSAVSLMSNIVIVVMRRQKLRGELQRGGRRRHGRRSRHLDREEFERDVPKNFGEVFGRAIDKKALTPALFYMMIMFCGEAILGFLVPYGRSVGVSNPGIFFSTQAICVFIASMVVGRLNRLIHEKGILLTGFSFYLIAMLMICVRIDYTIVIVGGMFFGFGVGFVQPELSAVAVLLAGPKHHGKANATVGMGQDIGGSLGSILFGAMITSCGYRSIYLFSAGIMVLMMIVYLWTRKKNLML